MSERPFWERKPLAEMNRGEWESLCDGCGKCCLHKLEDADTGEIAYTRVACKLLDARSCQCRHYATRHDYVPECIVLTAETLEQHLYWLPRSCAYKRLHQGQPLPDWHPLLTGGPETMHRKGASMQGRTLSESHISEDDWENYIYEETL